MTFAFDLISDLHVETWANFDWTDQATAPYCVVLGDVSRDRVRLRDTLAHLGRCYASVFFIDGNDEFRNYLQNFDQGQQDLESALKSIPNLVYLQDNVVVINGVGIIAVNGWWTFDFDPNIDREQTIQWWSDYVNAPLSVANEVTVRAYHDAAYLIKSIKRLQKHPEIKSLVVCSHTLPASWLADHDIELVDTWRFNCLGNNNLQVALDEDTENKIKVWCFGHYHKNVDREFAGVRFVNNCRGRGGTPWSQSAYYPRRIEVPI
jgi:predicted phosphodiesterase